ncbi:hypothetical protein PIROE2DRAFT_6420 [Piromyces sp. E2]|nr:hypothetical protein PIROE2DRAFT_6420 [Piromyces sp. E2]|eukprot:OUM66376.1 hypothetical protein PIROE2DRAFT_6420 [Piromyces sp. E2]
MTLISILLNLERHQFNGSVTYTLFILTVTSNVDDGKKTGSTPDSRKENFLEKMNTLARKLTTINVNVLKRETLENAMAHPKNYSNITISISRYAVNTSPTKRTCEKGNESLVKYLMGHGDSKDIYQNEKMNIKKKQIKYENSLKFESKRQ